MKKLLAIFICFAMCLGFIGCSNIEKKNAEAKAVLTEVLNKEEDFRVYNACLDKVIKTKLEKFSYPTYDNMFNMFVPWFYVFDDLDGDGIEELLIIDGYYSYFLFLRYDEGKVYGYVHPYEGIHGINTDGSFMTCEYENGEVISKTINRISFSGTSYEITEEAYMNDAEDEYLLEGKTARRREVKKYFRNWSENTTEPSWEKIN